MAKLDGSEWVLGFPRTEVANGFPGGKIPEDQPSVLTITPSTLMKLSPDAHTRARTDALEADETFLQAVVYGVLYRSEMFFPETFFAYRRARAGSEGRLTGKLSLGIGGHVQREDGPRAARHGSHPILGISLARILQAGLFRELDEEVGPIVPGWDLHPDVTPKALIYDPRDPVGRVHLGFVYVIPRPPEWEPTPCDHIEPVGWLTLDELAQRREAGETEGWTEALIPHLAGMV